MSYSKGANEWMEMISQNALLYLGEIIPFYSKVSLKRKELLTELQHMRKEQNTLFVLSKEVVYLVNLDPITLIGEKIVSDPKEVDSNWVDYLEWRLDIYDNLIKETNTAMGKYLDVLVEIRENCHNLGVDIMDEFGEKILEFNEIAMKFKETFKEEIFEASTATGASFSKLNRMEVYLKSYKTTRDEMDQIVIDVEKNLNKWKNQLQITTTPGGKNITAVITRYQEYRVRKRDKETSLETEKIVEVEDEEHGAIGE